MKSMTGFGRASALVATSRKGAGTATRTAEIDVSVRAVNGRFLEARVHVPREFADLENDLKRTLSSRIARGTVDAYVNRKGSASEPVAVARPELARSWLKAVRGLAREIGLEGEPTLDVMLKSLEVVRLEEPSTASAAERKALTKAFTEAVELCDLEREREGKALRATLESLLGELDVAVDRIESLRVDASREMADRFRQRLKKLEVESAVDPDRLAQEIAIALDRSDVAEEIARLREHLRAYRKLLKASGPTGKKLDFYAQELLRETNTVGSKSQASALTEAVVEAKSIIERIREQVQNAE